MIFYSLFPHLFEIPRRNYWLQTKGNNNIKQQRLRKMNLLFHWPSSSHISFKLSIAYTNLYGIPINWHWRFENWITHTAFVHIKYFVEPLDTLNANKRMKYHYSLLLYFCDPLNLLTLSLYLNIFFPFLFLFSVRWTSHLRTGFWLAIEGRGPL